MRWLVVLALVGCGGSDLTPDSVSHLPDGDAVGTAQTGTTSVKLYVTACAGDCRFGQASVCDVGQTNRATIDVAQHDGHLDAYVRGSELVVSRLAGGLWHDGRFDIGGWGTQLGGDVAVIARATGTLAADHRMTGQARVRVTGSAGGDTIECTMTVELR